MTERISALERIRQLRRENQTLRGQDIARQLLREGYGISEAKTAFVTERYVAETERFTLDVDGLHVSDTPLDGPAAAFASMETRALPWVIWHTDFLK